MMKQRLTAIIDEITESNADSATILKILRSWRDEMKEPVKVIECGYVTNDQDFKYTTLQSMQFLIKENRRNFNDLKVSLVIEDE